MKEMSEIDKELLGILNDSFVSPFLEDEHTTDVRFNGTQLRIQDNIKGRYIPEEQPTEQEVFMLVKRLLDAKGKSFNTSEAIVDTAFGNIRMNAMHKEVSPFGTTFALRISKPSLAIKDFATLAPMEVKYLLEALTKSRISFAISGATGSGKTEFQKYTVGFIDDFDIIFLMEDTMDSHLKEVYSDKDITSCQTKEEEGREKKIGFSDLNASGLRNNPDWMIQSETRGAEAMAMVKSALSGHSIITTLHALAAGNIVSRILSMISEKYNVNQVLMGSDIVSCLPIGVHMVAEELNGKIVRIIREIVEFTGFDEKGVKFNTLYSLERKYDMKTEVYEDVPVYGHISDSMMKTILFNKNFHLVPDCFIKKVDSKDVA